MSALSGIVDRLREGRFVEALDAAKTAVRSNPTDLAVRRTLFELLAAAGEWQRCRNQAEALGSLGDGESNWIGILGVINSCEARDRFWSGTGSVGIVGSIDEKDGVLLNCARSAAAV
jgi:protein involved in temperature-dependent protein secretion